MILVVQVPNFRIGAINLVLFDLTVIFKLTDLVSELVSFRLHALLDLVMVALHPFERHMIFFFEPGFLAKAISKLSELGCRLTKFARKFKTFLLELVAHLCVLLD